MVGNQMEQVTKENIKHRRDFKNLPEFIDYLVNICTFNLDRTLIQGRVNRGVHPYDAITMKKKVKPGRNHPYKRQWKSRQAIHANDKARQLENKSLPLNRTVKKHS
jgi:hypothetical protein